MPALCMEMLLPLLLLLSSLCVSAQQATVEVAPPGLFTTDASFAEDTHAVLEPAGAYSFQDLETAQPGLRNRLKPYALPSSEFHMKPVRVVHARAVATMPVYDMFYDRFIGSALDDSTSGFVAAMDTVTTYSIEGVMHFVQTQAVNQSARPVAKRCRRGGDVQFMVFYELLIAQPNASLAMFQADDTVVKEYGPFVPMDHGRCSPIASRLGEDEFPTACYYLNGNKYQPDIGPFIGAAQRDNETEAPYKDAYAFSFPHSCPLQPWTAKTEECRAQTHTGLCPPGRTPDGVHCTFTYSILGFLPLDDLVGITSMTNEVTGKQFSNFSEFCRFGGAEVHATDESGTVTGLPFWRNPKDASANANRTRAMIDAYNRLAGPDGSSTQIFSRLREKMRPLPPIEELVKENSPCFESVLACSVAKFGCRRETYAQLCHVCEAPGDSCVKAPPTFAFPVLEKPVAASTSDSGSDAGDSAVPNVDIAVTNSADVFGDGGWLLLLALVIAAQ